MSACKPEWSETLSAWFDGEVEAAERAQVEAHLGACAGCAALAGDFAAMRTGLRLLAPEPALALPARLQAA
ncbi:MAG TPA: zf-HC2 domain-containing protein, partial [Aggregicoccus sp.]|nr:zf-HC2 domain-containing protein [Aggregicoccus sp.]